VFEQKGAVHPLAMLLAHQDTLTLAFVAVLSVSLMVQLVGQTGIRHMPEPQSSGRAPLKAETTARICADIRKIYIQSQKMCRTFSAITNNSLLLQAKSTAVFVLTSRGLLVVAGVAAGCQLVQSVLVGSQIAGCSGCVTAVAELPPHSCCSRQQMLVWAQQLSQQVVAAESLAQGEPAVVAASGAGGLVAWCRQGWGVCLAPSATGVPSLKITGSRVMSVRSGSPVYPSALGISWQGEEGPNPTLLVKQGPKLHAVQLPRFPGGPAARRGLAFKLAEMGREEGMLLLSASTGQFLSSSAEGLLLLDVDMPVATQLSGM
jgi:hypothetical protein